MIFLVFICTLVFAPLAFGTVELWSIAAMEWLTMSAACTLVLYRFFRKGQTVYLPPGVFFLILFLGFLLLQIAPLPGWLVQYISPQAYNLQASTIGLTGDSSWFPLSLNRHATLAEFFRIASYCGIYFITVQLLTGRKRLVLTVKIVVILGSLIAILAMLQLGSSDRLIYWFRAVPANVDRPMGPYVYRNHFAGLMEMLCLLAIGLFLATKPYVGLGRTLRNKISDFMNQPQVSTHFFAGVSAVLMAAAIFVSLSRGGILSFSAALLCFVIILIQTGRIKNHKAAFWMVPLVFICVGLFGWDVIVERFFKTYSVEGGIQDGRLQVWQDTLVIIKDYWFTGTGAGTFLDVYPGYRTAPGTSIFDHAHNDYLELLATSGLIGTALISGFLFTVIRKSLQTLKTHESDFLFFISLGCLTGIIAILFHSITDFNFYNGANGLYFFFLCGLLVSSTHTTMSSRKRRSLLPVIKIPVLLVFFFVFSSVIFAAGFYFNTGAIKAKGIFDEFNEIDLSTLPSNELRDLKTKTLTMIKADPLEAKYYFTAGNIEWFLNDNQEAFDYYKKAASLTPVNSEMIQLLGITADALGKPFAKELLEKGARLAPRNSARSMQLARWLLFKGRHDEALMALHSAISADFQSVDECINIMESAGLSAQVMLDVMPNDIKAQCHFGRYFAGKEKFDAAENAYDRALLLLNGNTEPEDSKKRYYEQISNYYSSQKRYDKAIAILSQIINTHPDEARLYSSQGKMYKLNGENENAITAYNKAVSLTPEIPDSYLGLGAVLVDAGKHHEAEKAYGKALDLLVESNKAQTWMYSAIISYFEKKHDLSSAYDAVQKGVSAFPDSVAMHLKLGWLCKKMGKNPRAENAFARAWSLLQQESSPTPWLFRSIASFYFKDNPKKSIKVLQKGIESSPTDSSLLFMLGDLYFKTGKINEAKGVLQKGLKVSPDNEKAIKKLKEIE